MANGFQTTIGVNLDYKGNLNQFLKSQKQEINAFAAQVAKQAQTSSSTPRGLASSARQQVTGALAKESAVIEARYSDKKSPEYLRAIRNLASVGDEVVRIIEQSLGQALEGNRVLSGGASSLFERESFREQVGGFRGEAQNFIRREELTALDARLKDITSTQTKEGRSADDEQINLEGLDAALKRLYGLAVGLEQEFALLNDGTLSKLTVAARGMLTAMRDYSSALESTEANIRMTRQLRADPSTRQDLTQSRVDLNRVRGEIDTDVRRRPENVEGEGELLNQKNLLRMEEQIVKFTNMLAETESADLKKNLDVLVDSFKRQVNTLKYLDKAYMDQAVASKLASDVLRRTVNVQAKQLGMDSGESFDIAKTEKLINEQLKEQLAKDRELIDAKEQSRYARDLEELEIKTSVAQRKLNNEKIAESTSVLNQSNRELKRRANDAEWNRLLADGTLTEGSTWVQRLQMNMSRRRGQAPRYATDFGTGPQILAARAMTTIGFGISGAAMYGGVQLMKDVLNESTELQQELGVIEAQFKSISAEGRGMSFEKFKTDIKETAALTGVAANDVARIQRQLAGVFADPTSGTADYGRAQRESVDALRYTRISGLTMDQTTDDLTAISLAFKNARGEAIGFESILDRVTDAEYRFGVAGEELVSFTARMAPLAGELGYELDQLVNLGAIAQKTSALSGDVLSEQFGRMLPAMSEQRLALAELLAMNDETIGAIPALMAAFETGQGADALRVLVEQYENLNAAQKSAMVSIVGGRREAQTLFSILGSPGQTIRALEGGFDSEGSFEERWKRYEETVNRTSERLRRAMEEIGQKIFDAGLGDIIKDAGNAAVVLLGVIGKIAEVVGGINDLFGSVPGKILLAVVAAQSLSKVMRMMPVQGVANAAMFQQGGIMSMRGHGVRNAFGAARAGTGSWGSAGMALGKSIIGPSAALGLLVGSQVYSTFSSDSEKYLAEAREAYDAALEEGANFDELMNIRIAKYGDAAPDRSITGRLRRAFGVDSKKDRDLQALAEAQTKGESAQILAGLNYMVLTHEENLEEILRSANENMSNIEVELTEDVVEKLKNIGIDAELVMGEGAGTDLANIIREKEGDDVRYTIDSSNLTVDKLKGFIDLLEEDDENPSLLNVGKFLKERNPEIANILNEALRIAERDEQQTKELEEFLETRKGMEARASQIESNIDSGRLDFGELEQTYREMYNVTLKTLSNMEENTEAWFQLLPQLQADAKNVRDAIKSRMDRAKETRERLRGLSGQYETPEMNTMSFDDAMTDFNAISSSDMFNYMDEFEAALQVMESAQAILDQQLQDAIDNDASEEVLNKLRTAKASSVGVNEAVRSAVIQGQLAEALQETVSGTDEDMDALLEALQAMYDGDEEIARTLLRALEYRRAKLLFAIDFDTTMGEKEMAKAVELRKQIESQIEVLKKQVGESTGFLDRMMDVFGVNELFDGIIDPMEAVASSDARRSSVDKADKKTSDPFTRIHQLGIERARAAGDVIRQAELDVQIALENLRNTDAGTAEWGQARIALIDAEYALAQTIRERSANLRQIAFDLQSTRAHGDSVRQAQIARDAAYAAWADATTVEEYEQGRVAYEQAVHAVREAEQARLQAWEEYNVTVRSNNPIEQAKQMVRNAQARLARATEDQRPQAMAELWSAKQQLDQQWLEYWTALMQVNMSVAEGQGNVVESARLQLQVAQERLRRMRAMGIQGAPLAQAFNEVVQATTNLETTRRQDRLGDLDYLYEFDKITADMYINLLRAELDKIPESNKAARREIERKIKALRDEMGRDMMFNIPSEIRPTFYEGRRLDQVGGAYSSYQDNRQVVVNVNGAQDPNAVGQAVADHINRPPTVSSSGVRYY